MRKLLLLLVLALGLYCEAKSYYKPLNTPEEEQKNCHKIKCYPWEWVSDWKGSLHGDILFINRKWKPKADEIAALKKNWLSKNYFSIDSHVQWQVGTTTQNYLDYSTPPISPSRRYAAIDMNELIDLTENDNYLFDDINPNIIITHFPKSIVDSFSTPNATSWINDSTLIGYYGKQVFILGIHEGENNKLNFDYEVLKTVTGKPYYYGGYIYCISFGGITKFDLSKNKIIESNHNPMISINYNMDFGSNFSVYKNYAYFIRTIDGICRISRINLEYLQQIKTLKDLLNFAEDLIVDKNSAYGYVNVSPDGSKIVFVGNRLSPISNEQNLDIFIANSDGTGLRQLTNHPADDILPVFSIDGKSVYFYSKRGKDYTNMKWKNSFELYQINVE